MGVWDTEELMESEGGRDGMAPAPATGGRGKSAWGDRILMSRLWFMRWDSWASTKERTRQREARKGTRNMAVRQGVR